MASLGCRPQKTGQFFHVWRQTFASCLLSLLLCIALLHATVAPTQYRPLTGTTVLYEVRAASVHSETITYLALAATQNAYTETNYTDWFFHIAKVSYARAVRIARPMPRLACHGAITPNTIARWLHTDDCSIARIPQNFHQHGYAGISVFHTEKGEQAFQQPIYLEGLQVSPEQQKSLFDTGFDLNAAVSKAMKANPDAVYVQNPKQVLASCLICQQKAITNVPMVSSLAGPQSWRERVSISNIPQMSNTSHASLAELRKSLEQQCNRLLPGSVTNISVPDLT